MSLSSHKIYGPKGCGALIIKKGTLIDPLFLGGGQEQGLRAGTENVAAIVGFGKAAELATLELKQRTTQLLNLRNLLEDGLKTIPGLTIFSQQTERLPNTVQFGIPQIDGEMMLMNLDKKGFSISSGSACSSGGNLPSSVLVAMQIESGLAKSALRVSLGITNTVADIYEFINQLKALVYQV
jgi:cysteine desulfurase